MIPFSSILVNRLKSNSGISNDPTSPTKIESRLERGFNLYSNMPERSCAMSSVQACIAIDVSKDISHVCVYISQDVMVQNQLNSFMIGKGSKC